jgi:hypothetical protein
MAYLEELAEERLYESAFFGACIWMTHTPGGEIVANSMGASLEVRPGLASVHMLRSVEKGVHSAEIWAQSARSCMSSREGMAIARKACPRASCGARCMKSIAISAAKVPGSSITPNDTVPAACRNFDHRRHGELPGQSANE